jgi:hydrogenase maturation protease
MVVGYGNPLRGDDAFGFLAAERLRSLIHGPEVEVLALHQLAPELMEPLARAELAIFIDASAGPPRSGGVAGPASLTHHQTPESLASGARALYGSAAKIVLLTHPGANFGFGEPLSAAMAEAMEATIASVRRMVSEINSR